MQPRACGRSATWLSRSSRAKRLGIIGRNGSGKSTLLKILSRITDPTEGRARLRGRVGSLLEVGTGFHPDLTGRENILLNGAVLGMTRTEIRRKFDEIVDFAEIEQFLDVPVKHYSSGMYVRLAFAVAAHLESEILIVDEVLSVGDAAFQRKCMGKMENVGDNGRTVLFVSHATSTVTRLCTHGLLLDHGQVKAYGHAADIVHEYLGRQMSSRTVYELPPNPRQAMALRKVHLNPDAKEPTNDLSYEDDIVISIEYEVNKELEDAVVWFALQTMEGEYVFVSADHDIDQSMLGVRKPGYYHAKFHVPGKWLNVGEYLIVVGLNKNRPVERYNREDDGLFQDSRYRHAGAPHLGRRPPGRDPALSEVGNQSRLIGFEALRLTGARHATAARRWRAAACAAALRIHRAVTADPARPPRRRCCQRYCHRFCCFRQKGRSNDPGEVLNTRRCSRRWNNSTSAS